ncbi:hypothetical protein C8F04DRAFT_1236925, partial [Mycena alexandri]
MIFLLVLCLFLFFTLIPFFAMPIPTLITRLDRVLGVDFWKEREDGSAGRLLTSARSLSSLASPTAASTATTASTSTTTKSSREKEKDGKECASASVGRSAGR